LFQWGSEEQKEKYLIPQAWTLNKGNNDLV
jgi:hypothetical protein